MKILHTADWHLGDRLGRIDRTGDLQRAVERVAAACREQDVDVLLVAGDLFSELSRPDDLRGSIEHLREVFLPFLRRGGTIVALTGNHDNETFCRTLRDALTLAAPDADGPGDVRPGGRLHLASGPTFFRLAGRGGEVVQFVLMPFPTPSRYLDEAPRPYRSFEEKNRILQAAFASRLRGLKGHPKFHPAAPTVMAAHIHVEGAVMAGPAGVGERNSILLPECDVPTSWAYVALGHIHQPQPLMGLPHVRYCGSIERLDLGERHDAKGAVLVDVGPEGLRGEPAVLPIDATPIYDVEVRNPQEDLPRLRDLYPHCDRALVRYRVTYTAGSDNLDAILRELDAIFPRWYDRSWSESGELGDPAPPDEVPLHRSLHQTVLDYLNAELADHRDREAVLRLAEVLLAEEAS